MNKLEVVKARDKKMLLINGKEISGITNLDAWLSVDGRLTIQFVLSPEYFSLEASCSEEQKQ